MPSFSSPSSIRVASQDHVLRLKITHNLVHGSPSDAVHHLKGRLPKELDVLWMSDIALSLSGSLNGRQVPAYDMNADRLGLNNVSRPFVDDADGLPKLTLTPSRPLPDASRPHANLVSLHLDYIWRSVAGRSDIADSGRLVAEIDPFSSTLFLPAETLLNRVTEQFLIYHVVSRYPLIFGPWCKRLDLEMQYFPFIAHSIVEMMSRSGNRQFVSKCGRLIKLARKQHKFVLETASAALSSCTDEEEGNDHAAMSALTDEQVLCASLEQLFRMGVPQRRFKPTTRGAPQIVGSVQDDESLLQCIPDAGADDIDDEDAWEALPDIMTSPLICSSQPLPDDVDIFVEDWPGEGDGMWRFHDADVGLGEREFDDESDASLIGGSISLASITMRSGQAGPVTPYHGRKDTDEGKVGPLRCKVSKLAYSEAVETSAGFAGWTHSPSHEQHYSEKDDQVMGCMGTCQDEFWTVSSGSDVDSDAILCDAPDEAELTEDEPLV